MKKIDHTEHHKYWKENLRLLAILLSIWFLVSFVFGILLVDQLNTVKFAGFPLGFWFAQQGSIIIFVILIFVYVNWMNRLDAKYGYREKSTK
jgi:putative solute:sodium symporter small subunit